MLLGQSMHGFTQECSQSVQRAPFKATTGCIVGTAFEVDLNRSGPTDCHRAGFNAVRACLRLRVWKIQPLAG